MKQFRSKPLINFVVGALVAGLLALSVFTYLNKSDSSLRDPAIDQNTTDNTHVMGQSTPSGQEQLAEYAAPQCSTTTIPYQTLYFDHPGLYKGETSSRGGKNGYTTTCESASNGHKPADVTKAPEDKIVYVGTRDRGSMNPPKQHSHKEANAFCHAKVAAGNPDTLKTCIDAYLGR